MSPKDWIPLRWSAGPLDVAVRKDISAGDREALLASLKPESLGVLQGSPFNCVVLDWGAGKPEDSAQRDALKPLIAAAKARGLDVVGQVTGEPDSAALTAARDAGLSAVLLEKSAKGAPLPVIALSGPAEAGRTTSPLVALKDCEWPSVRTGKSGNAESGPTGYPWVDSSGWMSQLARSVAPAGTAIWSTGEPKPDRVLRADHYVVAVADAAAWGSRWVVALEPATQAGLVRQSSEAKEIWSTLVKALRFFEAHKAWQSGAAVLARLGVLSDFEGENEYLAQEVLNLSARRQLPVRVVHSGRVSKGSFDGLKALVSVDTKAPAASLIDPFLAAGGTLIVPPSAAHLTDGKPSAGKHATGYQLTKAGAGLIAVAPEPWVDPYLVAQDAHRLMGRKNDVVRLWNSGSSITYPTLLDGGKRAVAHIVNYTGRAVGHPMSLWIARPYAAARFVDIGGRSEMLTVTRKGEGTEVNLPALTAYAAIEFGEKLS